MIKYKFYFACLFLLAITDSYGQNCELIEVAVKHSHNVFNTNHYKICDKRDGYYFFHYNNTGIIDPIKKEMLRFFTGKIVDSLCDLMHIDYKDSTNLDKCEKKDLRFIPNDQATSYSRKKSSFKKYTVYHLAKPIFYNDYVIMQCRLVEGAAYSDLQLLLFKKVNDTWIFIDTLNYSES